MGKTLYLECGAGISGDMVAAALLDLGADKAVLDRVLESMPADGFSVEVGRVKKAGIDCCDFRVKLDAEHENHDHDMEYLHGKNCPWEGAITHERIEGSAHNHEKIEGHGHSHEQIEEHDHSHADIEGHSHGHVEEHDHSHADIEGHSHGHAEEHDHGHEDIEGHSHEHHHDHHHHAHRGMREIMDIIDVCDMTEGARKLAVKIFQILAQAEAKAHAVPVAAVHFHEVGAVDSIVDIVAAAVCVDNLGITDVIIPKLVEGCGTVRCQHGILPIPVPATANIIAEHGLNLQITEIRGEFVTPTGAAIAAALKTSDQLPEEFKIRKIGIGAGKRTYEKPSILRAMLIESQGENTDHLASTIWKLESNIDDCTGEALGYVMEQLFAAGARDVHYMPVYMKKNRPGWQLNVICSEDKVNALEKIIFRETTTIGIRKQEMERTVMEREIRNVETTCGEARVKVCSHGDIVRYYPEYESVASIARKKQMPYAEVYREVMRAAMES